MDMNKGIHTMTRPMYTFSGIKPTGDLHLGSLIGSILLNVDYANRADKSLLMLADLHAITVPQNPTELRQHSYEILSAYIAAGANPDKTILFAQSHISEHAELAWVMNCMASIGQMERMTQYKDQVAKKEDFISMGILAYPALMAADILLYDATHVPVGEDQKQHVELARDLVGRINHRYSKTVFTMPEPIMRSVGARIMSLKDGTKKMSKSDPSSCLFLMDSDDEIINKIKRAKTDTDPIPDNVEALKNRPEVYNLISIYSALSDTDMSKTLSEFSGGGFGVFKPKLAQLVVDHVAPIRERMKIMLNDTNKLDQILKNGYELAKPMAKQKLEFVYDTVGFLKKA